MDVNTIIQLVSSVGFPIVCCGAMAYYVKYITDKNRESLEKLNNQHQEEVTGMTDALNNNTLAIQRLCDKLSEGEV